MIIIYIHNYDYFSIYQAWQLNHLLGLGISGAACILAKFQMLEKNV